VAGVHEARPHRQRLLRLARALPRVRPGLPRRVGPDGRQGALGAVPAPRGRAARRRLGPRHPQRPADRAVGRGARRRQRRRDRDRAGPAGLRPVRADRRGAARQRGSPRLLGTAGAGAAQRQDRRARADGGLRRPHPRRRPARRPVAARPRPGRRTHRPGGAALDGHPGHRRGVARVDRAAVRHDRPRRRTRSARAGDVRRRARHRDVRRAQRLGQAPHRGTSVRLRRRPCGPR